MLVFIGESGIAQNIIFEGNFLQINLTWSVALILGIYLSSAVSGAHLNPAVTIVKVITHNFSLNRAVVYISAQCLAGFFAAALVFTEYFDSIHHFDPTLTTTQGIFSTFPQRRISVLGALFQEILATAVLVLGIYCLSDENNRVKSTNILALGSGILFLGIGTSMGHQTCYALNPARDFPPRIFSYLAGYGTKVFYFPLENFNYRGQLKYYWWIPIFGPIIGAILGGSIYILFIGAHWETIAPRLQNTQLVYPERLNYHYSGNTRLTQTTSDRKDEDSYSIGPEVEDNEASMIDHMRHPYA